MTRDERQTLQASLRFLKKRLTPESYTALKEEWDDLAFQIGVENQESNGGKHD